MDSSVKGNAGRELDIPAYVKKRGAAKQAAYASSRAPAKRSTANRTATAPKKTVSGGKKGTTKRKRRKKKLTFRTWLVAAALVGFAVFLIALFGGEEGGVFGVKADNGTLFEGIYIENIYVGGKTTEQARTQVEELARVKLSATSLTLVTPSGSFELSAGEIGLAAGVEETVEEAQSYGRSGSALENARVRSDLKEEGKNFTIPFTMNVSALETRIAEIKAEADTAPMEPYAVPSLSDELVQSFEFFEGRTGYSIDVLATAALVKEAVGRGELDAQITAAYTETEPSMTAAFLKENTRRISTFTTRFRAGGSETVENRVFNIRKTAGILNCHVVAAGETFSFNDVVGPRTNAGGWKDANGISGGKEYTLQAGGGVCQTSTTLYNALLCGNLSVTERRKHSIPSDYVDYGLDATVDTSGIDLKFLNDTGAPIYLFVYIKPDPDDSKYLTITVSLYGKALPEGVTYQPRSVVTETIPREDTVYTEDPAIPLGYQLEKVKRHDGFVAEAYLDKYVNGTLESSQLLYTDKYRGNPAEVSLGTGDPLTLAVPEGSVPVPPSTGGG